MAMHLKERGLEDVLGQFAAVEVAVQEGEELAFVAVHERREGGRVVPADPHHELFVGRVEVGVAQIALVGRESRLQTAAGERRIPADLPDTSRWAPVGRLVVGGEWRPVDRFGVTLAGHGQWIDSVEYGLGLGLTWYGYR
jgi:hypothetical protein